MIKKEELYELVIEDENIDGIFAISLVQDPAIEADFVYFDKEKVLFSSIDNEKRLVMGAILIPNKKILRIDGEGKPYYVFFKPETIKRLSELYLQNKLTDKATLEHNKKINGVTLVESWIKESPTKDKSVMYNLNAPVGSWVGTFRIDNDEIWNDYVKTGDVKGFSIEGVFGHSLVSANEQFSKDAVLSDLDEQESTLLLRQMRALIKRDNRYKTKERVEMESYSDYGDGVANNAKKGIELNEKNGNKCATPVGKVRAQQLAQKKPISVETIKRMHSYLSRAEVYYDQAESNSDCGYISFMLWGGKAGLGWSRNKLRELGMLTEETKLEAQPSVSSTYPGEAATGSIAPATFNEEGNIEVYGIETEYFYLCPGAVELFTHLQTMDMDEDTIGMVRSAALVADRVFDIEEDVLEDMRATPRDLGEAITLVKDFKDIMKEIDDKVGMEHDVKFMDGHIQKIKSYL
jgi:hypothetical protein